jgi:hypothetical protein
MSFSDKSLRHIQWLTEITHEWNSGEGLRESLAKCLNILQEGPGEMFNGSLLEIPTPDDLDDTPFVTTDRMGRTCVLVRIQDHSGHFFERIPLTSICSLLPYELPHMPCLLDLRASLDSFGDHVTPLDSVLLRLPCFDLCQLSETCTVMRDVCAPILDQLRRSELKRKAALWIEEEPDLEQANFQLDAKLLRLSQCAALPLDHFDDIVHILVANDRGTSSGIHRDCASKQLSIWSGQNYHNTMKVLRLSTGNWDDKEITERILDKVKVLNVAGDEKPTSDCDVVHGGFKFSKGELKPVPDHA